MHESTGVRQQQVREKNTWAGRLWEAARLAQSFAPVLPIGQPTAKVRAFSSADYWTGEESHSQWLVAGRVYAESLWSGAIPHALAYRRASAPRIFPVWVEMDQLPSLPERLRDLYSRISPGDLVVVDVTGATRQHPTGITREGMSWKLFESGFCCPLIWAGRDVLRVEAPNWLTRFIGLGALGTGPRRLPGISAGFEAHADRIVAVACRSDLDPPDKRKLRLSVVMPVYNERSTFREVLDRLLSKTIPGCEIEICIIESNSTDGTRAEVLQYSNHPRVRLILEDKPCGKGHAVRAGLNAATGDFILIQDADLEYDLDDYEKLLAPLREGTAGFVLGSRHRAGERVWQIRQFSDRPSAAHVMNFGHLVFAWMLNITFGQKMRDPFTMFKVFRRDAIHNVRFECNRFDFDIELVGKLIRQGYRPLEIDINYNSRSFDEGKKVSPLRDPPTWIRACLKHRFSALHQWP